VVSPATRIIRKATIWHPAKYGLKCPAEGAVGAALEKNALLRRHCSDYLQLMTEQLLLQGRIPETTEFGAYI